MIATAWYIHPEVWGAIGSCVAGGAAIAGLIGLWFYVRYTKRIMEATLASWRGQIEPVLVVEFDKNEDGHCHFVVRNAGNGPALETSSWSMEPEDLSLCGTFVDRTSNPQMADALGLIRPNNPPDEDPTFDYPIPAEGEKGFYVIQTVDTAGGMHQKHVLYSKKGNLTSTEFHDVMPSRSTRKW